MRLTGSERAGLLGLRRQDLPTEAMSVASVACPDCRHRHLVAYDWDTDELVAPRLCVLAVREHAKAMPLLHPIVLPDHHARWRTA